MQIAFLSYSQVEWSQKIEAGMGDFFVFVFMPSKIYRIVRFCADVDLLVQKPFWFFINIDSISSFILFSNVR